jgi:hypothetical protein
MKKMQECKTLMESVVICLYECENFTESRCLDAMPFYIEGQKRRLERLSVEYHILIRKLKKTFFDIYGVHLNCPHKEQAYSQLNSVSDFFQKTLVFFEDTYDTLHEYANKLMPCLSYNFACILLKHCNELLDIIIEYKRIVGEGDLYKWNESYLQRVLSKEQTTKNTHDSEESKEEKYGL